MSPSDYTLTLFAVAPIIAPKTVQEARVAGKTTVLNHQPKNREGLPTVQLDKAHSPSKVLAHAELLEKFVNGEEFNPIHLRIGITGRCNMRCTFCNFHSENENKFYDRFSFSDEMKTAEVLKLVDEFANNGGRALTFCRSGEASNPNGQV